jgi:hypothetical protein
MADAPKLGLKLSPALRTVIFTCCVDEDLRPSGSNWDELLVPDGGLG